MLYSKKKAVKCSLLGADLNNGQCSVTDGLIITFLVISGISRTYLCYLFRGICGGDADIMLLVEHLIPPLVSSYVELYNMQKNLKRLKDGKKDEFFGLRDFYR